MGKKKRFIDKKNAVSFRLVHRSQRDPLQADEGSSRHVLLPVGDTELVKDHTEQATGYQKETVEGRKKQQRDYGVFYDDDYDYLQHLKPRTDTSLEPLPSNITVIEAKKSDVKKFGKVALPSEVFASHHEENEGLLNLAAPVSGPRLDWDPDIVAALDDALDLDDPDNVLDDDFILKANESLEEDSSSEVDEQKSNEETDDDDCYFPSDENMSDDNPNSIDVDDEDDIKSRFSNFSMTSSVIRRTEGLCLLDDRFDKIMEEYDDNEIGALDHEEVAGDRSLNDPLVESIKNEIIEERNGSDALRVTKVSSDVREDRKWNSEDDELTKIEETPTEHWDCESILSTYSNLYNHPTLIKESSKGEDSSKERINLSKREGIPLGVLSDGKRNKSQDLDISQSEESQRPCASHLRTRGETKEEKKARKQLVKQERQARRVEKKTNKLMFKEERKRQERSQSALVVGQKIQ